MKFPVVPALVLTFASAFGCASFGQLDPKAQRAVDTFECYVEILEPYVGEVCDTADLVRDVVQGKADVRRTLVLLSVKAPEVEAIITQLAACISDPGKEPDVEPASYVLTQG